MYIISDIGSCFAHKIQGIRCSSVQYVEWWKNTQKTPKNIKKGVDKWVAWWYYSKAVCEQCGAQPENSICKYGRFRREAKWWSLRSSRAYLTEFSSAERQRTLKIKQCKTERKHTQYPLILTQYWEESGNKKLFLREECKAFFRKGRKPLRRQRASWVTNSNND